MLSSKQEQTFRGESFSPLLRDICSMGKKRTAEWGEAQPNGEAGLRMRQCRLASAQSDLGLIVYTSAIWLSLGWLLPFSESSNWYEHNHLFSNVRGSLLLKEGRKYSGSGIGLVIAVFGEMPVLPLMPFFPALV
jgi:hypothetical protein